MKMYPLLLIIFILYGNHLFAYTIKLKYQSIFSNQLLTSNNIKSRYFINYEMNLQPYNIVKKSLLDYIKVNYVKLDKLLLLSIFSSATILTSPNINRSAARNIVSIIIQKMQDVIAWFNSFFFKLSKNKITVTSMNQTNDYNVNKIQSSKIYNNNKNNTIIFTNNDKGKLITTENLFSSNKEKKKFLSKVMNEPIYYKILSKYYYNINGKYAEKPEMFESFLKDPNINLWLDKLLHKYKKCKAILDSIHYSLQNDLLFTLNQYNDFPILKFILQENDIRKNLIKQKLNFQQYCDLLIQYISKFQHPPRYHDTYQSIEIGKFYYWLKSKITSNQDPLFLELSKHSELKEYLDIHLSYLYKYHQYHNHLYLNKNNTKKKYQRDEYKIFNELSDKEKFDLIYEYINIYHKVPKPKVLYKNQPIGNFLHQYKQNIQSIDDEKYLLCTNNMMLLNFINKYLIQRHKLQQEKMKSNSLIMYE